MSDYIRREDAVDALKAQADTMRTWVERYAEQRRGILTAVNIVEDIKPSDVVPVVRCKECKHVNCRIYHGWQEPIYTCTRLRSRWNTDNDLEVNPNGFCSYGERKE